MHASRGVEEGCLIGQREWLDCGSWVTFSVMPFDLTKGDEKAWGMWNTQHEMHAATIHLITWNGRDGILHFTDFISGWLHNWCIAERPGSKQVPTAVTNIWPLSLSTFIIYHLKLFQTTALCEFILSQLSHTLIWSCSQVVSFLCGAQPASWFSPFIQAEAIPKYTCRRANTYEDDIHYSIPSNHGWHICRVFVHDQVGIYAS